MTESSESTAAPTAANILGPEGPIARAKPGYEARPQQLEMAGAVAHAIETRTHLAVEAGTGVGKSFAYLVPAILAAVESGRKVVVSTHTISLQEQLLRKDIPFLREVMPKPFNATLVKGRGNYVSLRRLGSAAGRVASLFPGGEEAEQLARLAAWSEETADGSRSDLDFRPLPVVWDEVASDADNCMGKECPRRKECFYFAARGRVESAHVLVVNHALYMIDLVLRRAGVALLPSHDVVVFDEAHTLEAVASEHLGEEVSNGQVESLLRKLAPEHSDAGLLGRARGSLGLAWYEAADARVDKARAAARDLFGRVADAMAGDPDKDPETTLRFCEAPGWPGTAAEELRKLGSVLGAAVAKLEDRRIGREEGPTARDLRFDLKAARARCDVLGAGIDTWLDQAAHDNVYWAEHEPARRKVSLVRAPLEVGPTLRAELFDRVPTCILTSATLGVGTPPRFDHFTHRLGLDGCATRAVGSPFDYPRRAVLHLNRSLPCPSREPAKYEQAAIRAIPHYLEKTGGRAFVLFTSYKMLEAAARMLRPRLDERGIALIAQCDGMPRAKMIESFKVIHEAGGSAVLLGVDSFWQGVDVPGDALSNVIIVRLPFRVPDHPLLQARLEAIRDRGGNPFLEMTVPEAVIKLRQGFGRLIRSKSDRGIVVITDPRILSKFYGRTFLDSLPACPRDVDDLRDLVAAPEGTDADTGITSPIPSTRPPQ